MNLKQQSIRGVKWTTFSSAIIAITQLSQLSVLARHLSPHAFGLIAILMVVVNFSLAFVDFGISKAIIYKKNISNNQLSTLYWLNILFAIIMYLLILLLSPYLALFYHESSLEQLTNTIAISFLMQAFGQQFRTLFQKKLEFKILAKIDTISALIAFVIFVLLVVYDFKIYAFIYSVILVAFLRSILLVYYGSAMHKIKMVFNIYDVKEFLSFGFYSVGNGIVSTISTQIDVILVGKLLGTEVLGAYSVAKELILRPAQLINPTITKVAFPAMSKVNHNIEQVNIMYLRIRNAIASVNFPIYVIAFVLASNIIELILGTKWLFITPIFQILSIWAMFRSIESLIGSLVMALGKPQYEMQFNIGMMVYIPIMIYIGSQWGLTGVVYGNLISTFILLIPDWYFLVYRLSKISLMDYIGSIAIPLFISLLLGLILYMLFSIYSGNIIYRVFMSVSISIVFLWLLYKKYNQDFYNIVLTFFRKSK